MIDHLRPAAIGNFYKVYSTTRIAVSVIMFVILVYLSVI